MRGFALCVTAVFLLAVCVGDATAAIIVGDVGDGTVDVNGVGSKKSADR